MPLTDLTKEISRVEPPGQRIQGNDVARKKIKGSGYDVTY